MNHNETELLDLHEIHAPLTRAKVKGWVSVVFWALRIYIVVMLVLVCIGLAKGI